MTSLAVADWLDAHAPSLRRIDGHASTATVADAALALGVEPGRIAKSLAIRAGDMVMLLIARGDARLDNRMFKDRFGQRPRMLGPEETLALTGHPVGGVCPFGLATPLPVYCDESLRGFATVFPAAGTRTSSIEVAPEELAKIVGAKWVAVTRPAEA